MKVELYRTVLCPRCLYVTHALNKMHREFPELDIEVIEISKNLNRLRAAGVRTVPTLVIGKDKLSGLLLTPQKIRKFLTAHR